MPRAGAVWVDVLPNMSGFGRSLNQQIGEPVAQASARAGAEGGDGLMSSMKAKVAAGALAVGAAAGALVVKGLETSLAKGKASATLAAQLDISAADAKKAGAVAGKLWANSVTESVEEGAEAVKLVMGAGLVDSKASTKEIGKISTAVSDLAKLFDQDVTMATKAAASMVKSGFAKDGTEAVDAMTYGFQKLGVKAEDLAETFNEYSPFMKNFGLDAKDALGLMSQGLDAGAWDTDKIGDSFKELYLRITGGDQAVKDALKSIGLGGSGVMKAIADGGPGARKALDQILDGLRKVPDETTKAQAVQDLFGGPGEDLGAAIFSLNVDTASKSVGDFAGSAKKAGDALRSDVGTSFETFKRKSLMAIGDATSKYVLPRLMDFGRYLHSDALPVVQKFGGFVDTKVVPAVKGLGSAFMSGVRWVKEYGIWFAPLAIAIGGVTLAMSANAIATGITMGVLGAYSLAIRGVAAVTRVWAAAQALFNAVMALNPVTLIIIGVVALGAALVVAYKKSETFRNIVTGVWSAIKAGWAVLWSYLKPGVDAFMTGLRAVGTAAAWLWSTVLSPVFGWIGTAARILVTAVVVLAVLPIIAAFKVLAAVGTWLWGTVLSPVFGWIGDKAGWLWSAMIKPAWNGIMTGIRAVGAVAKWLWSNVFSPVLGWIGDKAGWLWSQKIKPAFDFIKIGVGLVGTKIKDLWNTYARPVFGWIGDKASWLWDKALKPAFDAGKKGVAALGEAFDKAKDAIKKAWDKVEGIAKKPVRFIIENVYNKGIVPVWNKVAGAFGAPKLETQPLNGFARGGVLPGQSSWRQGDDQLVPMRRGEGVYVSEAMRDPYERARLHAVNRAAMQGRSLAQFRGEGFAKGGIFDWVKSTASKGVDLAKTGVGWLKDGVKASAEAGLNAVVKPLLTKISGSASVYRDMVTGIPKRMIKDIIGYSGKADGELEKAGIGGKGFKSALAWARTQAGKAYQWGGNGNPSWDCSGFVSAIESVIRGEKPHRRWATGAFSGATAPPGWVLGAKSPFMIGITNSGVGHTAGTINGTNVESRGGDGVVVGSRARSYLDPLFTHRYGLRGFADGGSPRPGEIAWVGEHGPELIQFSGGEVVYSNAESMRMAAGLGPVRGFAKGTSKASATKAATVRAQAKAQSEIPGDLTSFRKSLTGTASAIQKAADALTKDLAAAGKAGQSLVKSTEKASAKLQSMAKQRDAVTAKIKEAKSYAADKAGSLADFLGVSNLGDVTSVGGLISGLKDKQATAKAFQASLATLQKRGASKDLIAQLVEMGPDSKLAGLVAGASAADLKQVNALVKSSGSLSKAYGNGLADLMYDSGKDASKGFLAGLIAEEKAIQAAMAKLGNSAIKAIRSKKGIDAHSPSRKGAQAGADVGAGVVAGMAAMGPAVASAAERLGDAAVPAAALVPVTSQRSGTDPVAALDGAAIALVLDDGTRLAAHFDARVDAKLTTARRTARAGTKTRR